jgi:hypothetical protein
MSNCCYFSGAGNGSNCYELYDKTRIASDIQMFSCAADEMVNLYGQKVEYYVNTMNLLSADLIYGEQPTSIFHGPITMKMMINLNESSFSVSKFGFQADDDVTAYTTYSLFVTAFSGDDIYTQLSQDLEPKSGDVFKMSEYGNDRINGRGGNFFEVTERRDQNIGESMNPLGGHYGWMLKAKRMEYSWQPGLPNESANEQVNDDNFYGKLSSTIAGEVSSVGKSYIGSADQESVDKVLDMSINDTSMYGTYDLNP